MSLPSPTRPSPPERQYTFTVALIIYSALKKQSNSKAVAKCSEKSIKTKEFLFAPKENNYVDFLQSIHGKTEYMVSSKWHFPFKFTVSNQ